MTRIGSWNTLEKQGKNYEGLVRHVIHGGGELTVRTSNFNATLTAARRHNWEGVYDVHTNVMQYPLSFQPTHARIEQVPPSKEEELASDAFPAVAPIVARNFMVTDIHLETPPTGIPPSSFEQPFRQPNGNAASGDFLASFRGLGVVSDEIRDLLPEECRAAFDAAAAKEQAWHGKWGKEKESMSRREPVIDKAIVPYSWAGS